MKSPSHRTLARLAGVSTYTISLALRNSPMVAIATRKKITKLAKRHGYVPNAALAKVMAQIRATGREKYQATLAYLDASQSPSRSYITFRAYKDGAIQRSLELGYRLDCFDIGDLVTPPKSLERILMARGIRGLIFMWPHHQGIPDSWRFLWKKRSCVFLAARPESPSFALAMSDHFNAGVLCYKKAWDAGYRRIALVVHPKLNITTEGRFLGGILSQQKMLNPGHPVDVFENEDAMKTPLIAWYKRIRPDCIITMRFDTLSYLQEEGIRVPRKVSLIHWDVDSSIYGQQAGPEQDPVPIAHAAVNLLVGQIHQGEVGAASKQKCVLVEPVWRNGRSLRVLASSTSQRREVVRDTGFEPSDSTVPLQPLTGQSTQGGTQIPSDPILARLVAAWPSLSDERKNIIGSLLNSP